MKENQGKKDNLKFFEIAKVYFPKSADLPKEDYKLSLATDTDFFDLKGIVETLLKELHIEDYRIEKSSNNLFTPTIQGEIIVKQKPIGILGQLKLGIQRELEINKNIFLAELNFDDLIKNYRLVTQYNPVNPYAVVKLDLTVKNTPNQTFDTIKKIAYETSNLLTNIDLINLYEDKASLRFYFSKTDSNITEVESKKELEKIKEKLSS